MTLYKIRNKNTGLFSKGGSHVRSTDDPRLVKFWWSKVGKTWSTRGALLNHLAQYVKLPYRSERGTKLPELRIPEDWEIIQVEVVETIGETMPAKDFYVKHSEHFKK